MLKVLALCALRCGALVPRWAPPQRASRVVLQESLGGALFNQVFGGLKGMIKRGSEAVEETKEERVPGSDVIAGRAFAKSRGGVISSIDERAQSGNITFEDFLQVGRTFRDFKGAPPGMPGTLTQKQIAETLEKFNVHEKIVLAMTDEERADPAILMADIVNVKEKLPRTQRLARAASLTEREVALFMAEFEAMRRSTQRIAAGEDENAVNDDIGSSNRAARRQAKAALAKGESSKGGRKV
ncbi:hypothetical protein M885DRAFT_590476 [Pelagophyceae sp. CCMP2097]|nr:hypothetical protein M885DRAFT_590476 [Pelagophyceae sp. CCMP2097]